MPLEHVLSADDRIWVLIGLNAAYRERLRARELAAALAIHQNLTPPAEADYGLPQIKRLVRALEGTLGRDPSPF